MIVSIIVAMDRRGLIGDGKGMPWHLPKDLRRFREHTLGKPIIMGRTTFESIGKALPGRLNIVLTKNPAFVATGCQVARTLSEALSIAEDYLTKGGDNEAMIIGGGKVYTEAIGRWDRLYLTLVDGEFTGTTYFPVPELLRQSWRPACDPETYPADEKNRYAHSFYVIERVRDSVDRPSPLAEGTHSLATAEQAQFLEDLDLAAIVRQGTIGA